jgi:hypothetical protein
VDLSSVADGSSGNGILCGLIGGPRAASIFEGSSDVSICVRDRGQGTCFSGDKKMTHCLRGSSQR